VVEVSGNYTNKHKRNLRKHKHFLQMHYSKFNLLQKTKLTRKAMEPSVPNCLKQDTAHGCASYCWWTSRKGYALCTV